MIKYSFEDPSSEEKSIDICWHNLKIADETFNLSFFWAATAGWLNLNPNRNFQDLEEELRNRNYNTHLFASKPKNLNDNTMLLLHSKDEDTSILKWECYASCRPKEHALEEVLKNSSTYEENFEKLKFAGRITIKQRKKMDKMNNKEKIIQFNDKTMNDLSLLTNHKKKLVVNKISEEEFFQQHLSDIRNQYQQQPKIVVVGIAHDGSPLSAISVNNEVVSHWGFVMSRTSEPNFKLIDLRCLHH